MRAVMLFAVAAALAAVPVAANAAARSAGRESLEITIVASGASGTRTVVHTTVIAHGVLNGVGRDVELPSRPDDPPNVLRDKLVFRGGTIDVVATSGNPELSLDPQTCAGTIRLPQTAQAQGGTGRFRHASGHFKAVLQGWTVAARNPDGTCSQTADSLLEVAVISATGRLSI
jgi:hypothetical protein